VTEPGATLALRSATGTCLDGGMADPAAVHDVHAGTGPPGGRRIRVPGVPAADGGVRRAAVLSGPARPGAGGRAVRYREDKPEDLARARAAVAAWRGQNPAGTSEDLVAAIGCQFHPDYGVVLRALLFAADRHQAQVITGNAAPGRGPA